MTINTVDLFFSVMELLKNNCQTVEVDYYPEEDDFSEQLVLNGNFDELEGFSLEPLYDINSPDYEAPEITSSMPAPLIYSNEELEQIHSALSDGAKYLAEQLKSVSLSATDRSSVSKRMKEYECLRNELSSYLRAVLNPLHK